MEKINKDIQHLFERLRLIEKLYQNVWKALESLIPLSEDCCNEPCSPMEMKHYDWESDDDEEGIKV